MTQAHRRHDISDKHGHCWSPTSPVARAAGAALPKITACLSTPFSGSCAQAPWRDLPPDLGHWSNTHRRFIRWRDKGVWEKLPEELINAFREIPESFNAA